MTAAEMEIAAITLDLDDTLWPIEPVIVRAEERLDAWLQIHCPRAAAAYPILAMRELRERVAMAFAEEHEARIGGDRVRRLVESVVLEVHARRVVGSG